MHKKKKRRVLKANQKYSYLLHASLAISEMISSI